MFEAKADQECANDAQNPGHRPDEQHPVTRRQQGKGNADCDRHDQRCKSHHRYVTNRC